MKISLLLCVSICLFFNPLYGQNRNDFTWILGYNPSNPEHLLGGNIIDYNSGNISAQYFNIDYEMWTPCTMSDDMGALQFYTNGCRVLNSEDETMENGDDLNSGVMEEYYCNANDHGYPALNSLVALPFPGHADEYFLFHIRRFGSSILTKHYVDFLYSHIDMKENMGHGTVIEKNQFLLHDTLTLDIQAVRHGNGRDYWVMVTRSQADAYYMFLLDTSGVHFQFKQTINPSWVPGHRVSIMSAFSPDGTKYVRVGVDTPAVFRLYDFDRCSGILSNSRDIHIPDAAMNAPWVCFSPNSRFLYFTNAAMRLYQFDTEAPDIESSVQLIGEYDGFTTIYNLATTLYSMTIGPDQKIHMSSNNGSNYMHTIHRPDEAGTACDFRQHDFEMPAHIVFYLPNMPNYRLYQQQNMVCDSLGVQAPIAAFWRSEADTAWDVLTKQFTDISWYQPVSWHWDFGDGATSGEKEVIHTFPAPGVYEVCLSVCNADGLCDTLCREIDLQTSGTGNIPLPSPSAAKIYPNPTAGECWITHAAGKEQVLLLYDLTGKVVFSRLLSDENEAEQLNIRALSPGIYQWEVAGGHSSMSSGRLVILPRKQ